MNRTSLGWGWITIPGTMSLSDNQTKTRLQDPPPLPFASKRRSDIWQSDQDAPSKSTTVTICIKEEIWHLTIRPRRVYRIHHRYHLHQSGVNYDSRYHVSIRQSDQKAPSGSNTVTICIKEEIWHLTIRPRRAFKIHHRYHLHQSGDNYDSRYHVSDNLTKKRLQDPPPFTICIKVEMNKKIRDLANTSPKQSLFPIPKSNTLVIYSKDWNSSTIYTYNIPWLRCFLMRVR